ncbi:DUF1992 domain-containing protein [Aeromicrobium stalagmiti]|uniref:DnaJ family domain-containing protein n=1 Tax=Aeromicrobium stalagmiti TaxID=2738988 RepID=UPI00156A440B|nr:DUF1992 domain-containing protein [Aeromicrobium stalagmiti]NRQ50674.1 DUF1992 domain-containing protein [Aeromicrobium stalagmiti]
MSARDRKRHEYRLRLETEAAAQGQAQDQGQDHADAEPDKAPDEAAASRQRRRTHQPAWVEIQIQQAMRDGEFDNLPGAGKPIPGIDRPHDPDWWLKRLIEREKISVLPPALALRTEDARLDEVLDRESVEAGVRRVIDDFNARVIDARRQLQGGPPVITPLRDADAEVAAWTQRRADKVAAQKRRLAELRAEERAATPPAWWRRLLARLRILRRATS